MAQITLINYQVMERTARSFGDAKARVVGIERKLAADLDALQGGGWQSEASASFYRDMAQVMDRLKRLENALDAGEQTILRISLVFQSGEREAQDHLRVCMTAGGTGFGFGLAQPGLLGDPALVGMLGFFDRAAAAFGDPNYRGQFRAPGALFDLTMLGITQKINDEAAAAAVDAFGGFIKSGVEGEWDFSKTTPILASLSDATLSALVSYGLDAATRGVTLAVDIGSAVNQAVGGVLHDGGMLWRDAITGFTMDDNLLSFTRMTESIEEFRGVLEDTDYSNITDSAGGFLTDVYTQPILNRSEAFIENPSLGTAFDLALTVGGRTNPMLLAPAMFNEFIDDPNMGVSAVRSLADTVAHTADFVTGVGRLPGAYVEYTGEMALGTSQRLVEVLPISSEARAELQSYVDAGYANIETSSRLLNLVGGAAGLGLSEVNRAVDFSDQVDTLFERFGH